MGALEAVLLVGAHREELAFGERVAEGLDPGIAALLRIPEGISGHRPRPDEMFYYEQRHRELYLQILRHVRGRYELMIDLHSGVNQPGRSADAICRDAGLLREIERAASNRLGEREAGRVVRSVQLTEGAEDWQPSPGSDTRPGTTVIPAEVWSSDEFLYVGLEVYLTHEDHGVAEDWEFARELIVDVVDCARELQTVPPRDVQERGTESARAAR